MRYFLRIILCPAIAGCISYFVAFNIFRMEVPRYDRYSFLGFVIGLPVVVTFFSQLHRLDVLRRLEDLEKQVRELRDRGQSL